MSAELGIGSPHTLRGWVRKSQADAGQQAGPRKSWWRRALRASFARSHPILAGIAVTVLGGLVLAFSQGALGTLGDGPALELDQVTLSDANYPVPFTVDIKLVNNGSQTVLINAARLVIERFATVTACGSEGAVQSDNTYQVNMPKPAVPGEAVSVQLNEAAPADRSDNWDRFIVKLGIPLAGVEGLNTDSFYLVHLYLLYGSGDAPLDAGTFTVYGTLPMDASYYWTKAGTKAWNGIPVSAQAENCLIGNSRTLEAILAWPGQRTASLASLRSELSMSR